MKNFGDIEIFGTHAKCLFCHRYCSKYKCVYKEIQHQYIVKARIKKHIIGCIKATDLREKLWNALRAREFYSSISFYWYVHTDVKNRHMLKLLNYIKALAIRILGSLPECKLESSFHEHNDNCILAILSNKYNRCFDPPMSSREKRFKDAYIGDIQDLDYDDSEYNPSVHVKEDAEYEIIG
ncbi:MAG: hypothetical protein LBE09_04895 [Christensenellaceae bacterium]|nr:hypothetical protein [Christensenellaceae bacterium]